MKAEQPGLEQVPMSYLYCRHQLLRASHHTGPSRGFKCFIFYEFHHLHTEEQDNGVSQDKFLSALVLCVKIFSDLHFRC